MQNSMSLGMKKEMLPLNQTSKLYTKRYIYRSPHIHLSIKSIRKPLSLWYLKSPFEPFIYITTYYQTLLDFCFIDPVDNDILESESSIPGALQWTWHGVGTIGDQTGWASCFGTIEADPSRARKGEKLSRPMFPQKWLGSFRKGILPPTMEVFGEVFFCKLTEFVY